MSILLFIIYLVILCYWLFRWGKKHLCNNWLRGVLIIAFLLRVGVGSLVGIYMMNIPGNDSWRLFNSSKEEAEWLLHDQKKFFYNDIFDNNGYEGNPFKSFFYRNSENNYFNDLKDNIVIKFNAVLNIFSGYNYYINVLIANFLVIWALLGLIKVFQYWLKPVATWTIFYGVFLYLPLVLWTSNIQKDMLSLLLLSVFLFTYSFAHQKHGLQRRIYWVVAWLSILLLLLIKNYMALILFACIAMVWLAKPNSKSFSTRFWCIFGSLFLLFIISSYWPSSINLPLLLARKQNGFYDIGGSQPIPSVALTRDIGSYVKNLPNAIMNSFFFPLSKDLLKQHLGWIGIVVCLLFSILTVVAIQFPRKVGLWKYPFFLSMFTFSTLNYLLIGESVAYYGALLRYRAISETIFLILLLQLIDFKKIRQLYINKKNI